MEKYTTDIEGKKREIPVVILVTPHEFDNYVFRVVRRFQIFNDVILQSGKYQEGVDQLSRYLINLGRIEIKEKAVEDCIRHGKNTTILKVHLRLKKGRKSGRLNPTRN